MFPTTIKSYDPSKCTLLLGGVRVYGFSDGTKISVSRNNNLSTLSEGVDGDGVVNIDPRNFGKLTFSLFHTSSFNAAIYAHLKLVRTTGITPLFPVTFIDPSGQMVITLGWFESQPNRDVGQEATSMEWIIGLQNADLIPATSPQGTLEEITSAVLSF